MIPVLEIGGTHVTGALVDPAGWTVGSARRFVLDADGSADELIGAFVTAARTVDVPDGQRWGVAMPDPFDYANGIALFDAAVAKFGSLHGVDVRARLRAELAGEFVFLNDADAFVLGEWTAGAAVGASRCAGITLGTGVGSGWLLDGRPVDPGVPPGGRIHRMGVDGRPLEDVVSRRAIRRAFVAAGGDPEADVREIASAAREGEDRARDVIDHAFEALGRVVGECVAGFGADVLVIGGSMAASWDLFAAPFTAGAAGRLPDVRLAADSDASPVVGAAAFAA